MTARPTPATTSIDIDDSFNTTNNHIETTIDNSQTNSNNVINIDNSQTNSNNVTNNDNRYYDNSSYYYSDNDVTNTYVTNTTTTSINSGNTNSFNQGGDSLFPGGYYPAVNPGYGFNPFSGTCFGVSSNPPGHNSFEFYLGSAGMPTLYGTNFIGAYDRDVMYGTAGNDILRSGHGQDVMYGNGGADTFVLKASTATHTMYADFVADFDPAYERDVVILKGIAPHEVYYDRVGVVLDGAPAVSAVAVMDSRNGLCLGLVASPENTNPTFLFCATPVV
jgi:Ca2+-binding RTX toxin-like protein